MSDDEYNSEEYNSEEETAWDLERYDGKKNVAVIVIDNGPKMFIKSEDATQIPFKICLLGVYELLDSMLLNPYKRNVSINILQDEDFSISCLNDNLVDTTKKILELTKTSDADLKQKYERKMPLNMQNTLTECLKQVYSLNKANPYIVILTNEDDPVSGDKQAYLSAEAVVADSFPEKNVKLVILPLTIKFNFEPFYKNLLRAANEEDLDVDMYEKVAYDKPQEIGEILRQIVKDKVRVHRYVFNVYEKDDKKLSMWVEQRYFVQEKNIYHNVRISRETNNEVVKDYVHKEQIDFQRKWIGIGNDRRLIIERDERLKLTSPYGFRLLYINDKQSSIHRLHKRSFIIQADETQKGDKKKQLFKDMWMFCTQKKKVMVCAFSLPRGGSEPNLVELIPDRFLGKPCFVGIYLVSVDECKPDSEPRSEYERNEYIPVNKSLVNAFSDVIDKITIKYNPDDWSDEVLERKSKTLKEHLLETELSKMVKTFPSSFSITQQLGEAGSQVEYLLESTKDVKPVATRAPKRKKPC